MRLKAGPKSLGAIISARIRRERHRRRLMTLRALGAQRPQQLHTIHVRQTNV
jgi:hypothetical protein